jgi:hypothetical protein
MEDHRNRVNSEASEIQRQSVIESAYNEPEHRAGIAERAAEGARHVCERARRQHARHVAQREEHLEFGERQQGGGQREDGQGKHEKRRADRVLWSPLEILHASSVEQVMQRLPNVPSLSLLQIELGIPASQSLNKYSHDKYQRDE